MSPSHILSSSSLSIGCTLTFGMLGLMLALCWAKICRLTFLLQRREQRINRLLTCDRLTALNNRASFFLEGERLLQQQSSSPNRPEVALISLRIDDLKAISSEFGRPVVDELLQQLARRLRACMDQSLSQRSTASIIARVGATEFALLIASASTSEAVNVQAIKQLTEQLTERLLEGMHQPFLLRSHTIYIHASGGIAWATRDSSLSQLLLWANTAASTVRSRSLTAASFGQQSGQKTGHQSVGGVTRRYAVFHTAMEAARISQLQLKQALAKALDRQELRVRYQPIVELSTAQTVGFEALVRWQHPELGLLNPDTFLPLAADMGLSVAIDRWVLQHVCQQLWQWQTQQLYPSVSVNLSGAHLSEPDLADSVQSLLECYPIDPSQLMVEVTESMVVADLTQAISTLERLKQMGLRVSLDDFGTGYCSLTYLSQFPVDVLKIDRSFVSTIGARDTAARDVGARGVGRDTTPGNIDLASADLARSASRSHTNEAIVQSVLTLADALEIQVVAEGIEYASQYQWLRQRKCAYGQGNFFAEAITQRSAKTLLNRRFVNVA